MVQAISTGTFCEAKWVVDPTAGQGTHTTIASALTSASSGDTIFIRPGTYTENLTLKAGVNLTAFTCDPLTPNVTVVGKATFTAAGTVSISGIRLQTNSDFLLAVTGSAASIVNLEDCYLNCTNNTGISFTTSSGSSQINLYSCITDLGTTGIGLYTSTAGGTILFEECDIRNSGTSTTASTNSVSGVTLRYCICLIVFSCSSTGSFIVHHSGFGSSNTTQFTLAGTGSSSFEYNFMNTGNAACISIGSGTTGNVFHCRLTSSSANVITGAGTLVSSENSYPTTATTNVTTNTIAPSSVRTSSVQPAFFAYPNATINNVTGDGTTYTIIHNATLFDLGSNFNTTTGTFTAPFAGKYQFNLTVLMEQMSAGTTSFVTAIVTSGGNTYRTYLSVETAGTFTQDAASGSVIISLAANETVTSTVQIGGGTKTADVSGLSGAIYQTSFSGFLVC